MTSVETNKSVCILLATFNGGGFLAEQLSSLLSQTYKNWVLVISDDGSTDHTLAILEKFKTENIDQKIILRRGPREGFVSNFMSLLKDVNLDADYFAFCDQDDVWLPDKLHKAVLVLDSIDPGVPALYCGRTTYVNERLERIGESPNFVFPPTFRNALVQNIASGNTMVLNKRARGLVVSAGVFCPVSHDWWIYILVSGCGGSIHFDKVSHTLYRQHSHSAIGSGARFSDRLKRIRMVFSGQFKNWTDKNLECLYSANHLLDKSSLEILKLFSTLRVAKFKDRVRLLEICGLYRQTWRGTLSLYLATILKKI